MQLKDLKKQNLPDDPGVYFFRKDEKILYIGKATSLRDRVRSYFSNDLIHTRGSRIVDMISLANKVEFKKTDSVLEALILESTLIKKFKPKYNVLEKDNKSYNLVVITAEDFPRVLIIREKDVKQKTGLATNLKIKKTFGPFPNGAQLKEALKIVRKIFPFFDTTRPVEEIDQKSTKLNFQIGLYPNVFADNFSKNEYLNNIKNIELFFSGKKTEIVKNLDKLMRVHVKNLEFEQAGKIKKTIFALQHIKDVSLISKEETGIPKEFFRIEAFDVAHMSGQNTVGVMTVFENNTPKKADYRKFIIKTARPGDDYGALRELLERRFAHLEWPLPEIVVIDGGKQHLNVAKNFFQKHKIPVNLVSVVKDERHKPKEIIGDKKIAIDYEDSILKVNAEAHRFAINFHKKRRSKIF